MIAAISPAALAERCGGRWHPEGKSSFLSGLALDSRKIAPGDLFVAIPGAKVDGHDYVAAAQRQGAAAALVNRHVSLPIPQIVAENTELALAEFAAMVREHYHGVLVGVTGSAGKTTAKNMLQAVLGRAGVTLATEGNFNNELGVPLTLAGLTPDTEFAVLELAAGKPGDIAHLCAFVRPTVAVLLNVAPAHLAHYDSLDAIADTKGAILDGLPENGLAVVNGDQPWSARWCERVRHARCVTFGLGSDNDYRAEQIVSGGFSGSSFLVNGPRGKTRVEVSVPGRQGVCNALAAVAVACELGVSHDAVTAGLAAVCAGSGRGEIHALANGCRLVDDSYNANPLAVGAAIEVLADESGRRRLVLGAMLELGVDSDDLHREVGAIARDKGVEELWVVGSAAAPALAGFGHERARYFASNAELLAFAPRATGADVILIKGSRATQLEQIVAAWTGRGANPC